MAAKEEAEKRKEEVVGCELYIMRHGIAVERGSDPTGKMDDTRRPLTPEGKKKIKQICEGLLRLKFEVDWIVSSPLVRALETAEIVAEALPSEIPLDICPALEPGGAPEKLFEFLGKHQNRKRILVVGHEPDLSDMARRLIGAGRAANLTFKKGGCCLIRLDSFPPRTPGHLEWWLAPRLLRRMA